LRPRSSNGKNEVKEKHPHRIVAVGGTFDHFHKGHKLLLLTAFQLGDEVMVGITSDDFLKHSGKAGVSPYGERLARIKEFLKKNGLQGRTALVILDEPLGPAITDSNLEGIIVTAETAPRASLANRIRLEKGMPKLAIYTVDLVLADDQKPISSTRIRNGEIDETGRVC